MRESYSQAAEDLIAALFLPRIDGIRYIDVGCYLPVYVSNTYFFYKRGGEGVCIDPNPDIAATFIAERPRDTFVNCGVAQEPGELTYHRFSHPVFNTFSEARRDSVVETGRSVIESLKIPVRPLTDILREARWRERYGPTADLLTVDTEGFEEQVIASLDFDYVRPALIILEMCAKATKPSFHRAVLRLTEAGYDRCAQTGRDMFFVKRPLGLVQGSLARREARRKARRAIMQNS
jgi:FkbM family methyltransferase